MFTFIFLRIIVLPFQKVNKVVCDTVFALSKKQWGRFGTMACRAESGGGVLEEGQRASPPATGSGAGSGRRPDRPELLGH